MEYTLQVLVPFKDEVAGGIQRKFGQTFVVKNEKRARTLLGENPHRKQYCRLLGIKNIKAKPKKGPKVMVYVSSLVKIGGIETFLYNFGKHFRDRNLTLLIGRVVYDQLWFLSHIYDNIIIDNPTRTYDCDTLLIVHAMDNIAYRRVKSNAAYQMVHCDWSNMIKVYPYNSGFKWRPEYGLKGVISVSETARQGLLDAFKFDSKVIYNVLDDDLSDNKTMTFITLSRASREKGIDRILQMARAFKKANKDFIWFLCVDESRIDKAILKDIKEIPELVIIPVRPGNKSLISHCDYLVQLSNTESFCYSAFEALQQNVPVILTRFPEAYNIVEEGKNGYLVDFDLHDLDVDKIFNEKPTEVTYVDRCNDSDWELVFRGEF